ncbi:hypothetical protein GA0061096_0746 [Fictibacillus enclensis]|uniref:Bacterial Pleckstrin homology domain-containing protein n=1 Tax=Fictibacillus enclensis TaxID=1017270 RepID=A0A0V8JCK8_9BACL|nr:hypothetical protein [Fictibacillus enclensis]KSU84620.1 hypothetical protein AS030_03535 [Fictibacillus enclensis]SCB82571.1 hypothetical protein GA0061096_0746 [Fictibacillus enclensis]
MSRHIEFASDRLIINFKGLTAAAALKKEITVPLTAISSVRVGDFKINPVAFRIGTSGITRNIKHGRFLYQNEWVFLSFSNHKNVLILDLDNFEYKKIILELDSPEEAKNKIESLLTRV